MAFKPYHNISGATAQQNELIAINDIAKDRISSVQITNTDDAEVTVDLYIFKESTDTTASETYYFLNTTKIPVGVSLILDNPNLLAFDSTTFSLYIKVGSGDTVDVMIKK